MAAYNTPTAPEVEKIPAATHVDGIPMATSKASVSDEQLDVLPSEYYDDFLSQSVKSRAPNPIRDLIPLSQIPGMLSMFGGLPAPQTFPFTAFSMTINDGTTLQLEGQSLTEALQYGDVSGMPKFINWLYGLQERVHGRKRDGEGWMLSVGCGSQDLLSKAANSMLDEGDAIIVEAPVYGGMIPVFKALKCHIVEVVTDADGVCTDVLESTLRNWPKDTPRPKLFYTVPFGCNPTGATTSLERRIAVLELARKYNFMLMEDDPYYYLYYGALTKPSSYFQLDADGKAPAGRVVRFDSFSKVLSAGVRIGFMSAPTPIVKAVGLMTASTTLQASSLSQAVCHAVLEHWGYDGFARHTEQVASVYRRKRDLFELAMTQHLSGLAEWTTPDAGMFVWFKLLLREDGCSKDVIVRRALKQKVLALPGTSFYMNGRRSAYVRASFSVLPENDFGEAMRRLSEIVKEVQAESAM